MIRVSLVNETIPWFPTAHDFCTHCSLFMQGLHPYVKKELKRGNGTRPFLNLNSAGEIVENEGDIGNFFFFVEDHPH